MARSTVNVAVLSVVLDMPSHGYDVSARFQERYRGLFRSSAPHVYRSLGTLNDDGLVAASELPEAQARALTPLERRRKCFYRATAGGARVVQGWLESAIPPDDARRELWIRLRTLRPDDLQNVLRMLDRYQHAVLSSVGYARASSETSLVDELAREDHDAWVDGQLRWLEGARQKLRHQAAAWSSLP